MFVKRGIVMIGIIFCYELGEGLCRKRTTSGSAKVVLLRSVIEVLGHIRIDPGISAIYINLIIRCIIIIKGFFQIYFGDFKFLIWTDPNTIRGGTVY